jgi:DNA-binding NtrC family response regulator
MEPARILVVDDDQSSRDLLARILTSAGHHVTALSDGREAVAALDGGEHPDLVVSDIRMAEMDGLQVIDAFRERAPDTPVILVTAFGNIDGAVEAIRRGAADYLSKPYDVDAIQIVVARALQHRELAMENRALRRGLRDRYRLDNVVGRSEAMLQVYKTAARVASTDATVLIQGESGTGKELVARAIHTASPRSSSRSCSATPGAPSPAPRRPAAASSRRPTTGPSSSTRSATSARTSRPACCARCRREPSAGSEPTSPSRWTCASWPPPTGTWRRR